MQGDCIGRRTDPYEFDATGEENSTSVDGLRRPRDDPTKPGSLFTSEGLQASYKDLDQIFDNSDPDTSSDETVRIAFPFLSLIFNIAFVIKVTNYTIFFIEFKPASSTNSPRVE